MSTLRGIRAWRLEDAGALASALNNRAVQDNLRDGIPFPYTESNAREYISAMLAADPGRTFAWAITAEDIAIGSIGVFRRDNVHRRTAEMGYYLHRAYWGKGIATEAVRLACHHVFANSDIVRIFADPYAFNIGSCRVLEKAGFSYEGTLRKNAVKNGKIVDMRLYAITRD